MQNANRLAVRESTSPSLIIGANGGKKVVCSSQALPHYNNLLALSRRGNYWATLVVRAIIGLNSGRLEKDNIYVDQNNAVPYGKGAFYLVLPGVTAKLMELPSGKYILQSLEVNHEYAALQKAMERPGLWRIGPRIEDKPEFLEDGRITQKDVRTVTVADRTKSNFDKVLEDIREQLANNQPTSREVKAHGFDLHFTPGGKGIVGLRKATEALASHKEREITKSAMVLAHTMYLAQEQTGVLWFSDFGGSAILTRALQILAQDKNTSLAKHAIFMNHPTSTSKQAIKAAHALGLKSIDRKSGYVNPTELIGHFTFTHKPLKRVYTAGAVGVAAAGAAFGLTGASLSAAGIVGVGGGLITVIDAVASGVRNTRFKKY